MNKNLTFSNNGILSLLDLTSMGDSSKRDDHSKTGKYDSGLKYAIAILLRNNIDMKITSGDYEYTFVPELVTDKVTKKEKHLIGIKQFDIPFGNWQYHLTGFAVNLGYDWEFWMAIRELYANCLDEGGTFTLNNIKSEEYDTHITLFANDKLQEVIDNWDSYFLTGEPVFISHQENIKIYDNNLQSSEFTIYKNGIKIFSDPDQKSKYVYDHSIAEIDEMRVIRDVYTTRSEISYALKRMNVDEVIKDYIDTYDENDIESTLGSGTFSQNWVDIINNCYSNGTLPAFKESIMSTIMSDNRFYIGKKKIEYVSHNWSPSVEVQIVKSEVRESVLVDSETLDEVLVELSFEEHIISICEKFNIKIEFPIIESIVSSTSIYVIGSESEKALYIDSNFSEDRMWEIVKEQYKLKSNDKNLIYKDMVQLLNK
jgi:hypothetical protein